MGFLNFFKGKKDGDKPSISSVRPGEIVSRPLEKKFIVNTKYYKEAICPYCGFKLKKTPQKKKKCQNCGNYIYVRTNLLTNEKMLLTEGQKNLLEKERSVVMAIDYAIEMGEISKKDFLNLKRRNVDKVEIMWQLLNKKAIKHSKNNDWGLYRNTVYTLSKVAYLKGDIKGSLVMLLGVCYIDVNGPNNVGNSAVALEIAPKFDPELGAFAPVIVEELKSVAKELNLGLNELQKLFIENANNIRLPSMPISPEEAWTQLQGYLNGENKDYNRNKTQEKSLDLKAQDFNSIYVAISKLNANKSETVAVSSFSVGRYKFSFPQRTGKLIYWSRKSREDISTGYGLSINLNSIDGEVEMEDITPDEPSTIFTVLPVRKPININNVSHPGYYPTYAKLTPEQRWIYLSWLQDVSQLIHIGYVFLYYYGLERQLLTGKFDLAIDEIIYLRRFHDNPSFKYYSNTALLTSCIIKKKYNRLEDISPLLYSESSLDNLLLLLAYNSKYDLTVKNLIDLSPGIKGINKRYINNNPDLFKNVLEKHLFKRYGVNYFPFSSKFNLSELPISREIFFANFSFPPEIRTPAVPNFLEYHPFVDEVKALFSETHEEVKSILREQRKKK